MILVCTLRCHVKRELDWREAHLWLGSEVLWGSGKYGFYRRYWEEGAVDTFSPGQVLFQFWGCSGGRRCTGNFLSLPSWLRVEGVGSRGCFWWAAAPSSGCLVLRSDLLLVDNELFCFGCLFLCGLWSIFLHPICPSHSSQPDLLIHQQAL